MTVTVKAKNHKASRSRVCEKQADAYHYVIKDYDDDGYIGAAIIKACLNQGILPHLNTTPRSVKNAKSAYKAAEPKA